jgi:hypothetical protein
MCSSEIHLSTNLWVTQFEVILAFQSFKGNHFASQQNPKNKKIEIPSNFNGLYWRLLLEPFWRDTKQLWIVRRMLKPTREIFWLENFILFLSLKKNVMLSRFVRFNFVKLFGLSSSINLYLTRCVYWHKSTIKPELTTNTILGSREPKIFG